MMRWTRFGRNLYAIGGNKDSALMLGINVKRTKFYSYLLAGLLSGVAGYVYLLHTGRETPRMLREQKCKLLHLILSVVHY